MSIFPVWNQQGVLPPCPDDPRRAAGLPRSPYRVTLPDIVQRFATSQKRIEILDGFLRYRAALHRAGLTRGFQWLDGIFLENKEAMLGQGPNDIDVATFLHLPHPLFKRNSSPKIL